jgi:hypothetical protein
MHLVPVSYPESGWARLGAESLSAPDTTWTTIAKLTIDIRNSGPLSVCMRWLRVAYDAGSVTLIYEVYEMLRSSQVACSVRGDQSPPRIFQKPC